MPDEKRAFVYNAESGRVMVELPRMFQYAWAEGPNGSFILDTSNAPPKLVVAITVVEGSVLIEWRHDVTEVVTDPDDNRWLAMRLIEAAVLADMMRAEYIGFDLIPVVEDVDDDVVEAEIVEDDLDPHRPMFDPITQQWKVLPRPDDE